MRSFRIRKLPSLVPSPGATRMRLNAEAPAGRNVVIAGCPTRLPYGSVTRSSPLAEAAPSPEWQLIAWLPVVPHEIRKRLWLMLENFGSMIGQRFVPARHCPAGQNAFAPQWGSMRRGGAGGDAAPPAQRGAPRGPHPVEAVPLPLLTAAPRRADRRRS